MRIREAAAGCDFDILAVGSRRLSIRFEGTTG